MTLSDIKGFSIATYDSHAKGIINNNQKHVCTILSVVLIGSAKLKIELIAIPIGKCNKYIEKLQLPKQAKHEPNFINKRFLTLKKRNDAIIPDQPITSIKKENTFRKNIYSLNLNEIKSIITEVKNKKVHLILLSNLNKLLI